MISRYAGSPLATCHSPLPLRQIRLAYPPGYPPDGLSTCRRRTISFQRAWSDGGNSCRRPPVQPRRFRNIPIPAGKLGLIFPLARECQAQPHNVKIPTATHAAQPHTLSSWRRLQVRMLELGRLIQAGRRFSKIPLASIPYSKAFLRIALLRFDRLTMPRSRKCPRLRVSNSVCYEHSF